MFSQALHLKMVLLWVEEEQKKLENKKVDSHINHQVKEEVLHQRHLLENQLEEHLEDHLDEYCDKLYSMPFKVG